ALAEAVVHWATDPAARAKAAAGARTAAADFTGAADRVFDWISPLL
ncbi:MAG: hypothetical protein FD126_2922, partial [Elusimicrobia bacterium]